MEPLLIVVMLVIVLDIAALRWGYDRQKVLTVLSGSGE